MLIIKPRHRSQLTPALVTSVVSESQMPGINNSKKKGFLSAHSFRDISLSAQNSIVSIMDRK